MESDPTALPEFREGSEAFKRFDEGVRQNPLRSTFHTCATRTYIQEKINGEPKAERTKAKKQGWDLRITHDSNDRLHDRVLHLLPSARRIVPSKKRRFDIHGNHGCAVAYHNHTLHDKLGIFEYSCHASYTIAL